MPRPPLILLVVPDNDVLSEGCREQVNLRAGHAINRPTFAHVIRITGALIAQFQRMSGKLARST
ncbi:MAG TPA: hypothetical protein VGF36_13265 [Rhodopila sp.]